MAARWTLLENEFLDQVLEVSEELHFQMQIAKVPSWGT